MIALNIAPHSSKAIKLSGSWPTASSFLGFIATAEVAFFTALIKITSYQTSIYMSTGVLSLILNGLSFMNFACFIWVEISYVHRFSA